MGGLEIKDIDKHLGQAKDGYQWVADRAHPHGDESGLHGVKVLFFQKPIIKVISPCDVLCSIANLQVVGTNGKWLDLALTATASCLNYHEGLIPPFFSEGLEMHFYKARIRQGFKFGHDNTGQPIPDGLLISYSGILDHNTAMGKMQTDQYPAWESFSGWYEVHGTAPTHRYIHESK